MADIEIIYETGHCELNGAYDEECFSEYAGYQGCRQFEEDKEDEPVSENCLGVLPYGNCKHAIRDHIHKGWSGKKYWIGEPYFDHYEKRVIVELGKTVYCCCKVKLNGKIIFNEYDEER